jgi:hypothetical protein
MQPRLHLFGHHHRFSDESARASARSGLDSGDPLVSPGRCRRSRAFAESDPVNLQIAHARPLSSRSSTPASSSATARWGRCCTRAASFSTARSTS